MRKSSIEDVRLDLKYISDSSWQRMFEKGQCKDIFYSIYICLLTFIKHLITSQVARFMSSHKFMKSTKYWQNWLANKLFGFAFCISIFEKKSSIILLNKNNEFFYIKEKDFKKIAPLTWSKIEISCLYSKKLFLCG